ncbi:MAG: hypothetical protein A2568_00045 [Candidatus Yanofskybacteria bacterium RIFOXYD1_FULL_44_17]|nr:MAG: hypothetical protein A2371_02655 [Candidatus Yanofskybacteria bacterium RIFOXYB1_FULL_44_29]OGN39074.1 MAG: hypothetical protein A2405_01995 [Candidatus Yanofskybacteria bacterium RIFOXYC1_FULL_44_16]OGN39382.1 MAG: hypothetical protein A2457_02475 [Candidatus Yanofskybacteria bacterium RIFOXYC2_FULL_44_13]OGN40632.1 MAG: hypothetical protein A2568_00045 [Candidatus Yanofskybacteria bacterium RIFOXYD1_FULL_44_17]HAU07598.1 hypothetical protein [Candidatus Yanofskybacteria bacterium]
MAKTRLNSQDHIDAIAWRCIKFVDSNPVGSRVLGKAGNPFSAWLSMDYKAKDIYIKFRVQNSPHSNGSSYVVVKLKGVKVFEANGKFGAACFAMKTKVYKPGAWEKIIPQIE